MHRSASTCSRALRNVRIAMSPFVIGAWSSSCPAKATGEPGNFAVPIVAAPAATIPLFINDRRFLEPLKTLPFSFIAISFSPIEFRSVVSSLQSVRNYADSRRKSPNPATQTDCENCDSRFEIQLRVFGEAWNQGQAL